MCSRPGRPTRPFADLPLTVRQFGTAFGDASPRSSDALPRVRAAAVDAGFDDLCLMQVAFTHRVATAGELESRPGGLRRTRGAADGLVLDEVPGRAVWVANADCPIGVLAVRDGPAVVLHLGLDCLWRPDSGPTLFETAVAALEVPPGELRFWVGCGIGPCCYGLWHRDPALRARVDHLRARYGADVIDGEASRGPRRGQHAYDLHEMALRSARLAGVGEARAERTCTSCAGLRADGDEGFGLYFSNVRDRERSGARNLVLVGRGSA